MKKLDEKYDIVREKKKGTKNAIIAEQIGISKHWVQKLYTRYKYTEPSQLVYPKPMGRTTRVFQVDWKCLLFCLHVNTPILERHV